MENTLVIPDQITVHTGPPDSPDLNYTLPFTDYIKYVVSRIVSPLWPEGAIRAVIYAAQTFALRRYTDAYYRSKGYDFDITGDADYDQPFDPYGCVFHNLNRYVDEMADAYISKSGTGEPVALAVSSSDGQYWVYKDTEGKGELTMEVACRLASEGQSALEILRAVFGDTTLAHGNTPDINIGVSECQQLALGDRGCAVSDLQRRLNLISTSFPNIPKINPADGFYGPGTEAAVREFQRTFELVDDGIAGCATRRRIRFVYETVRNMLYLLNLKNMAIPALQDKRGRMLTEGDTGDAVSIAQKLLNIASLYTRTVKPVKVCGVYDRQTTESVVDLQRTFKLPPSGDIDTETYNLLYSLHNAALQLRDGTEFATLTEPFGNRELRLGSCGDDVVRLQTYLNCVADLYTDSISQIRVTGVFDVATFSAVTALQRIYGLPQTGKVAEDDWDMIAGLYNDCAAARYLATGQYPGYMLERERSREVRY
jgi:peptidoglycan hydrolase-like protein with peptidoglycan-binding domain